jgi:hypothetical protein
MPALRRQSGSAQPFREVMALVSVLLGIACPAAQAQDKTVDSTDIPLSFTVPESPAFTFLGITPSKVTRSSNTRDLGATLINSIDSTGKMLNGVALSATLWTLLPNVDVNLKSYQHDWKTYALANAQLSFGAVRASGDTADTELALGLRTTFVDGSDPMRDPVFVHSLSAALTDCTTITRPPPFPGDPAPVTPDSSAIHCVEDANSALRTDWFKKNWNKPSLAWGVGLGWRVPRSEFGAMDAMGVSTWVSGSYPFGASGQLLGQLQFDHRTQRGTLGPTDVLTYGLRGSRGTKGYNLFFEVVGTERLKTAPQSSQSNVQWSGGVEFQAGQDYWLSTGFGKRYTAFGEPDRVVLIANLRWGISSKTRLRMTPKYEARN